MRISDWSSDVCSSDLWRPAPPTNYRREYAAAGRCASPRAGGRTLLRACGKVYDADPCRSHRDTCRTPKRRRARPVAPKHRPAASVEEAARGTLLRSEEHTSELQSLMRISYAVSCLKKNKANNTQTARKNSRIYFDTSIQ